MIDNPQPAKDHSPGPWTIEIRNPRMPAEIVDAERKHYVATVSPWTPHARANGLVIAAAPELLAALEAIMERSHGKLYDTDQLTGRTFYAIAFEAVARARS